MRSSLITLTVAIACLLGSSLASPVYDKRAASDLVLDTSTTADKFIEDAGKQASTAIMDVRNLARRSVPSDGTQDAVNGASGATNDDSV
ncbi:hypothetical protein RMATCC62417_12773 [Rhizopus microsporus]|nr:hypothetical protein RMATCC62417_12773 [Rhizopus microsporus]